MLIPTGAQLVACLFAVLLAAPTAGAVQIPESTEARAALVAALERLIATGEQSRTYHDEGQVLQLAVTEAINGGDREIERLGIRATSPLVASVSTPVSSTLALPSIEVLSRQALQVPRPVPFEATINVAANGAGFAEDGRGYGHGKRFTRSTGRRRQHQRGGTRNTFLHEPRRRLMSADRYSSHSLDWAATSSLSRRKGRARAKQD